MIEATKVCFYLEEDLRVPQIGIFSKLLLISAGFRILLFWNHDVLGQFESVKERIWLELENTDEPHPHLNPLPEGEEIRKKELEL